jgi:hypothetical protein
MFSAVIEAVVESVRSSASYQGLFAAVFPAKLAGPAPAEPPPLLIVSASAVHALGAPLGPVMAKALVPSGAVALAARVSVVEALVEAGLKVAVTPAAKPVAVEATGPLNPPKAQRRSSPHRRRHAQSTDWCARRTG